MEKLPHIYSVRVTGTTENALSTQAENLPTLEVAPPKEFDGPGDKWSPESLLMASVANCLILSFRAIAKGSKLAWQSIDVNSEGELSMVGGKIMFTKIRSKVRLTLEKDESQEKAEKLLNKAEQTCFVSNSLNCESHIECDIVTAEA